MTSSKASVVIRPAQERGHAEHGWLDSYHTFSFADYFDREHMNFRALRVINEDVVAPAQGFGSHPHRDMEIMTYIIKGSLKHEDSMGTGSIIRPGQIQKMSAGTGVVHSEFNASQTDPVHLLQIWIIPHTKGLKPSYQEHTLPPADEHHPLLLIGSPDGGDKVAQFHQDVYVYRGTLKAGQKVVYDVKPGRGLWLQMVKGYIDVEGKPMSDGDGASVENLTDVNISARKDSEFLVFDLG